MIRIKNWESFQHFKDRTPPWIKLYRELLDDPDWHELDGKTSKVLTMLWLLASEDKTMKGYLPDIRTISFRLRISESEVRKAISQLNHWLIVDDINLISERYQVDAPETETETYSEETETDFGKRRKPKKIGLDELTVDHIAEWLSKKRLEGKYLLHDEHSVLEKFRDYCLSTGRKYADYTAAYRNAFDWDKCKPEGGAGQNKDERAKLAVARAVHGYESERKNIVEKQW